MLIKTKLSDGIVRMTHLDGIDDSIRDTAKVKFQKFHDKGTVLNDAIEDMVWKTNDQKNTYTLDFDYRNSELSGAAVCAGKTPEDFIDNLKVYCVLAIGTCSFELLRTLVKYSIDETIKSGFYTRSTPPSTILHGGPLLHYIGFLRAVHEAPDDYLHLCKETLNNINVADSNEGHDPQPVTLNEFRSYFLLSDLLDEYWEGDTDTGTAWKQYIYPFYLYWKITTILPLRVTECCVTPYDCISIEEGRYYITIRRSRLKGSSFSDPKIRGYTLADDYSTHKYEITKQIYVEIDRYRKITEGFAHPHGTLFSVDHLLSLNIGSLRTRNRDKVFAPRDLSNIIDDFYEHVVKGIYGLKVVSDADLMRRAYDEDKGYEMQEDEIMMALAKHTRHLAMVNLIMRGCNPMLIKEFAGHEKIQTSEGYFSNIVKTVRCMTRTYYEKSKLQKAVVKTDAKDILYRQKFDPLSILSDGTSSSRSCVDGGICDSACFASGKGSDCLACGGECQRCIHFTPDRENLPGYQEDTKKMEEETEKELDFLRRYIACDDVDSQISSLQTESMNAMADLRGLALRYFKELELENEGNQTQESD